MRTSLRWIAGALLGGAAIFVAVPSWAQSARGPAESGVPEASAGQSPPPRYVPPMRGMPAGRVSGGTRGPIAEALRIDVLAPEEIGLTLREQPTLYWYNSRPIGGRVEVTLVADESNRTVLKAQVPGPVPTGINAFRLAGTSARLDPEVDYQWSVTAVNSTQEPSRNVVASGMIRRVARGESRRVVPTGASDAAAAATYAASGLWYDAVDALSQAIQRNPADRHLRGQRSSLLEQVGLKEAAEFDRRAAP